MSAMTKTGNEKVSSLTRSARPRASNVANGDSDDLDDFGIQSCIAHG